MSLITGLVNRPRQYHSAHINGHLAYLPNGRIISPNDVRLIRKAWPLVAVSVPAVRLATVTAMMQSASPGMRQ